MNHLLVKGNNISKILAAIIFIFTACVLCCKLFPAKNKPVFIFNHAFFTITSSSMEPEYPIYSIIVIKKEPFASLRVGDVIVYKANALQGGLAFHRITKIVENGFYTKGDKNSYIDNQLITENAYVGKGVFRITFLAGYIFLLHSPSGFAIFFILPCLTLILLRQAGELLQKPKRLL